MRLDPQPAAEELPKYYPPAYWFSSEQSATGRLEEGYRRLVLLDHVHFVERALRSIDSHGSLLDLGCGGGLFLGMMRERGFRVVGIDFSREAARVAWQRCGVPAVCGNFDHAPLRESSLACITMFHVLEHAPDPRAVLATAHRLLRESGRLVVQVPNAASWQCRLLGRSWNGVDVPRHLYDFRDLDLEKLLRACDFEVVRKKYFSWRDNPAGLAISIAPGLDPMARRVRRVPESGITRFTKDLAHLALIVAAVPFAAAEAACRAGSTVMLEARRR
jgi:SAM-dependent methyltransferase